MEGLSNDILELIFRQLENVSDMETCSKTCLKWNKIIGWINENLISCPFDGCSVKVTKLMLKDIRDHKMYCILNPEFQKLLQLLQDFNNITYVPDPKTGLLTPIPNDKKWHDSVNPHLRNYLEQQM